MQTYQNTFEGAGLCASAQLTCSMCGARFSAAGNQACAACPLQKGCQLVCCPNCGFEMVDESKSTLARAAKWFFAITGASKHFAQADTTHSHPSYLGAFLADVHPGQTACIAGFSPDLPGERKAQLQAYGVMPGMKVLVRQHIPATVIAIEHTELALETGLAQKILILH